MVTLDQVSRPMFFLRFCIISFLWYVCEQEGKELQAAVEDRSYDRLELDRAGYRSVKEADGSSSSESSARKDMDHRCDYSIFSTCQLLKLSTSANKFVHLYSACTLFVCR